MNKNEKLDIAIYAVNQWVNQIKSESSLCFLKDERADFEKRRQLKLNRLTEVIDYLKGLKDETNN